MFNTHRVVGLIKFDGLDIEVVEPAPCTDVRFFSQRKLQTMGTTEARAELARRAA